MKTRLYNDLIDCASAIYAENDIELVWLIKSGVVYDENQTRQQRVVLNYRD